MQKKIVSLLISEADFRKYLDSLPKASSDDLPQKTIEAVALAPSKEAAVHILYLGYSQYFVNAVSSAAKDNKAAQNLMTLSDFVRKGLSGLSLIANHRQVDAAVKVFQAWVAIDDSNKISTAEKVGLIINSLITNVETSLISKRIYPLIEKLLAVIEVERERLEAIDRVVEWFGDTDENQKALRRSNLILLRFGMIPPIF